MGSSRFSRDEYSARTTVRSKLADDKGINMTDATFAYSHSIKTGTTAAAVHPSLDPKGVKIRESRDSDAHPITVPIIVGLDTTGSMAQVPQIIQAKLPKLMGTFLEDKASGKRYLGDAYPAIMVAAVDDYDALKGYSANGNGTLQVGQFESGLEIDDNLSNLWLTGHGGGTYDEQYELLLYFAARHTAHDNWDKRGRKGYLFIIGDEHPYRKVRPKVIEAVLGESCQPISLVDIVKEVGERYHLFMIIPNLTNHYSDESLKKFWNDLLGQQHVLMLEDPNNVCECIAGAVALCEENIGLEDLEADGINESALVPLAKAGGGLSKYDAAGLPAVGGSAGGTERL